MTWDDEMVLLFKKRLAQELFENLDKEEKLQFGAIFDQREPKDETEEKYISASLSLLSKHYKQFYDFEKINVEKIIADLLIDL